jgi:hypothetical protein
MGQHFRVRKRNITMHISERSRRGRNYWTLLYQRKERLFNRKESTKFVFLLVSFID